MPSVRTMKLASCATLASVAAVAVQSPAYAQAARVSFNIPSQSLQTALQAFGQQSGQRIAFDNAVVAGKSSSALVGAFSVPEGLRTLLAGSGLSVRTDADGITLVQSPQDQSTESAANAAAIVVTARKRNERLLDVPAPVAVVTNETLARQQSRSLKDLTALVPGLNLIQDRPGESTIILRGITTGSITSSNVGIYIDDTPYGSSSGLALGGLLWPDLDPSDVQQVEVLRGPQGTLYGANAMGGVIRYATTPPQLNRVSGRVEVDGETTAHGDQGYGLRGMINVPLVSDTLGLRVSAYHRRAPGYVDDPNLHETNVNYSWLNGGHASLLWRPTPQLSLDLSAIIQDIDGHGTSDVDVTVNGNTLTPIYGDYQHRPVVEEPLKLRNNLYSASIKNDFGWASLIAVGSYSTLHQIQTFENTTKFGPTLSRISGVSPLGTYIGSDLILHKTTAEVRLQSPTATRLEWRVGGFFTHEYANRDEPFVGFNTNTGAVVNYPGGFFFANLNSRYEEFAGFGDITFHFTPKFDIAGGIRYGHNDQHYTLTQNGVLAGGSSAITSTSADHSVTYMITPRYKLDQNNMIYARIASGYHPGGPNATPVAQQALGVPTSYKPDTLTDFDLGYKGALLDRKLVLDLSAFYIDWRDIQIVTIVNGLGFNGNGGKAESYGFEGTATLTPFHGLNIVGNVAYTHAALTENAPGVNGHNGDVLPNVPKWAASVNADYDFSISPDLGAFVGGGVQYVGSRETLFITGTPATFVRPMIPAYTTVNLRAGIKYLHYTIEAYIKNLFDRRGYDNLSSNNLRGLNPYSASLIQPFTIGASVIASF